MFEEKVSDRIEGANVDHTDLSNALLNSAREVCGETTGRRQRDVQLTVREKKRSEGTEEEHEKYIKKNRQAKRMVAIAKDRAWKD